MTLIRLESSDGICDRVCSFEFILRLKFFKASLGRFVGGPREMQNGRTVFGFPGGPCENAKQLGL